MQKRGSTMEQKMDKEKLKRFQELTSKPYAQQAQWFLNAFWHTLFDGKDQECETVWQRTQLIIDVDFQKKKAGNELDEALSHKYLERLGETLTILDLREKLRRIDLDMNGYMSLSEYLIFFYGREVDAFLKPQANPEEVKRAMAAVAAASEAHQQANKAHEEAKEFAARQQAALEEVRKAKDEANRALETLQLEEKKHNDKCADLQSKADNAPTAMKKGLYINELSQLQSMDPLPLRSAKINQGAAVRKVEKAEKVAADAKDKAFKAEAAAMSAAKAAEAAFKEAEAQLEDVKSRCGSSEGSIWWAERELEEIRKYRPGYKPKPKN